MPSENKTPEEKLRAMMVWQAQAIALLKRACKYPGVLQEAVLDRGDGIDVHISVLVAEHARLIVPIDGEEWRGVSQYCSTNAHSSCYGVVDNGTDQRPRCECECHEKNHA